MSINSTRQEPYPPAPSSAHNIQGAAGQSSRPRHRGLAWVLAPSTFCRPNGRHRALCSKTGENAAQRCPRPLDFLAWSGRDGPNNTRLCSPAASCPRPPSRAPPCDLGQGLGAQLAPSSLRSEPRQKAQTAPSPLCPHSTLLSLPSVLLKCTRGEQGKGGAHPLCCYLQSRRPGGDIPPPCRHPTRRDRKEHVLGRVLATVQPCV